MEFTTQAEKTPIPTKSTTTHMPLRTLCIDSSDQLHLEGQTSPTKSIEPTEARQAPFSMKL
ncbi:hypothetical protein RHGRI_010862 [Rhododendron griersonianum]|uniref:Uncharacterized protein n=1 Tax=Rhododendron griersonianum TaxID=479676 RepID=A0AAV6KJW9_9ERIC|nr:hypothetical protein RHGRI_010862 [Rhododendron griersonianum]